MCFFLDANRYKIAKRLNIHRYKSHQYISPLFLIYKNYSLFLAHMIWENIASVVIQFQQNKNKNNMALIVWKY